MVLLWGLTTQAAEPATIVSKTLTPHHTHNTAIDLDEAFLMAVRRSETLQMKEEDIAQAAAKYKQLLGGILPQVSFKASEMIQHVPESDITANPAVSSTFIRRSTPYTAFNLTQPIFAGFKEWRAMSGSRATQSRTRHERNRAAQLLYQDVAQSFYTVLQLNNDVGILQRQKNALAQRVTELRERVTVGRSRSSEVAAAEAQLANVQAWLAETHGLQSVAWEMLEFLTGVTPGQASLRDPFMHEGTAAIDHYLSHSESREDVLAARSAIDEARSNVGVAKAGHYPTIGASANYYPYRVGFYEPIKWDVTFSLSFPIFQGGTVNAQIQEAKSKLAASHLNEQLAVRQSEKDIRAAYSTWRSSLEQARAYSTAAAKNRVNFEAQRAEYQTNLVSNLEVMQAQANWLDSERKANQLRHQSRMNYVQLLVAAGRIPVME